VNWYDAAAFCNLLTLADGSIADTEQVYYSDAGLTTAYTKANAASGAAVYVNWDKTGYRLPTEAEWEYAARYVDGTSWNGGDHVSGGPVYTDETDPDKIGDYAWYSGNNSGSSGDSTYGSKEVGLKTANALGLRDMSGNVLEWCYDWFADYSGGSETDPSGPVSGSSRVYRGGYWLDSGVFLRCAYRIYLTPSSRLRHFGFRPCRTAD
jgi:formylglycine-generating enzyme required for sulfatase activity